MFVNYSLKDIKENKICLKQELKRDIIRVIHYIDKHSFDSDTYQLFEIAEENKYRIYGIESAESIFYMKVDDKTIIPAYFKNHNIDGYSLFNADNIQEAINLYEKNYSPNYIGNDE